MCCSPFLIYQCVVLILLFVVSLTLATARDEYVAFFESKVVEPILQGQPELIELAHELMYFTPEDPTEFSAKRLALQVLMGESPYVEHGVNISEREEEFVDSGIRLLSPHIRSDEALRLGLTLLDLYNRTQAITPKSFDILIRLIAMPLGQDIAELMTKGILEDVENELGTDSDELKLLRVTLDRVNELVAKRVLVDPPQETAWKTRKPTPRCATQVCNDTLEAIYSFANERILVPILLGNKNNTELYELALKIMKTNVQNEEEQDQISSASMFLFMELFRPELKSFNGPGPSWFVRLVTDAIHKGPTDSEEQLVEFLQMLKCVNVDPPLAFRYYPLYFAAAFGEITGAQMEFSRLRGAIRTNPNLTPEQKEAMLDQTLRFRLPMKVCCSTKTEFPRCDKDNRPS